MGKYAPLASHGSACFYRPSQWREWGLVRPGPALSRPLCFCDKYGMEFSDYIIYVDESGDHSLTSINPQHPVFVLAFCIFEKRAYYETIVPAVQRLKFDF